METVRTIIYWVAYIIIGGFATLALVSIICGMVKCTYLNIKRYGWNPTKWEFFYNAAEGIYKK